MPFSTYVQTIPTDLVDAEWKWINDTVRKVAGLDSFTVKQTVIKPDRKLTRIQVSVSGTAEAIDQTNAQMSIGYDAS